MDMLESNLFSYVALSPGCPFVICFLTCHCDLLHDLKFGAKCQCTESPDTTIFFPFSQLSQALCHNEAKFNSTFSDAPLRINIAKLTRHRIL